MMQRLPRSAAAKMGQVAQLRVVTRIVPSTLYDSGEHLRSDSTSIKAYSGVLPAQVKSVPSSSSQISFTSVSSTMSAK